MFSLIPDFIFILIAWAAAAGGFGLFYTLTARASNFGSLIRGDSITVDSVAYTVRETMLIDDGKFVQIALQKT